MTPLYRLKRVFPIAVLVFIITVLVALIAFELLPEQLNAHTTLVVGHDSKQKTKDFKYDRYYAIESAERIGDFIEQSLKSPEIALIILENAGYPYIPTTARGARSFFDAQRVSPQSIRLSFKSITLEESSAIVKNAVTYLNTSLATSQIGLEDDTEFFVSASKISVLSERPAFSLVIATAMISGILFGIVVAFFVDAMKYEYRD